MTKTVFPSLLDPQWRYTNHMDTDIRKTFAKHGFKPTKKGKKHENSSGVLHTAGTTGKPSTDA